MEHNDLQPAAQPAFQSPDPHEPEQKSAFDRFIEVFTSPSEAFSGLVESTGKGKIVLWGMLIGIILSCTASVLFTSSPEMIESAIRPQQEAMEKMYEKGQLEEEQYEAAMEAMHDPDAFMRNALIFSLVGLPIVWVLFALIVWIVAKVLEQRDESSVDFMSAWSVLMIAQMISYVDILVSTVVRYLMQDVTATFSLAALIETKNPLLLTVLQQINPLTIWWIAVLGIGIATIANVEKSKGIKVWALVWMTLVVIWGGIQLGLLSLVGS